MGGDLPDGARHGPPLPEQQARAGAPHRRIRRAVEAPFNLVIEVKP
jgi:hypothetical protein